MTQPQDQTDAIVPADVAVQRVTPTDGEHYFFGYYDKSPWDKAQRRLLAMRSTFMDRRPAPDDTLELGSIDLSTHRFEPFATTHAWNWQQGCMLQWLDEQRVIYNDRRDGQLVSIAHDPADGGQRIYDRPIYALAPSGAWALSLNFARLAAVRPGYGYVGAVDPFADEISPADDGVHRVDLATGRSDQLISLAQLAAAAGVRDEPGMLHWVNHLQINREGTRFAFLHRWGKPGGEGVWWHTRLMAADADGGNLRCLSDHGMVSHYDWLDEQRLVAWASRRGVGNRYFVFDHVEPGEVGVIGEAVFGSDGHCSISPDRQYMLTDTYPDAAGNRILLLWHLHDERLIELGRFHGPMPADGEIRCDLHPRWSRDGRQICIDSRHEGMRAMYVIHRPD